MINQQADAQSLLFKLREKLKTSCCFHLCASRNGGAVALMVTNTALHLLTDFMGCSYQQRERSPQIPSSITCRAWGKKKNRRSSAGEGFSALSHHSLFSPASSPLLSGTTSHCSSGLSTTLVSFPKGSQQTN